MVNFGLRYEFYGVPFETNGIQGTVGKANLINSSARIDDLTIQPGSRWYDSDFNNFAPRIGLAWDPRGNGKTSLRANWGVFYDRLIGATTNSVDASTPGFVLKASRNQNSAGTDRRVSDDILPPQHPAVPELRPPATRSTELFLFPPNLRTGYFQHFSLMLQREIFPNTVLEAGAVKFAANYTFSKSMDNISMDGNGFTSPIDNFNVWLNRARGDLDIPHAFNASLAYTLPVGKGRRFAGDAPRWVDSLIGGWDIGLLTLWQSGPVVAYLSGYSTGPTTDSSYVNYSGYRNIGKVMRRADGVYWLTEEEISRFSYPAAGEIGTGGRNAFRGPRYFNVDMSLVKKFKIGARHAVSFRAEAYNLFKSVNFAAPNANLSTPNTFGQIAETVGNPRFLQLALRYDF